MAVPSRGTRKPSCRELSAVGRAPPRARGRAPARSGAVVDSLVGMKTSRGYAAWLAVSGFVCVAITIFAASAYVSLDMDQARPALRGSLHYGLLVAHIFTGTVAVLAGVSQFWPGLR